MIEKTKLMDMPGVYTVNAFEFGGKLCIGMGPEAQGIPVVFTYPSKDMFELPDSPGGMMSLIPFPGRTDMLVSVMGLFPPFIGQDAGIYRHTRTEEGWTTTKVISMPFAHRCEILCRNGADYFFASTVSSHKSEPSDWSKPGQVFFARIDDPGQPEWGVKPLDLAIYRNHGMLKSTICGEEVVCVSGAEGIFSLSPDNNDHVRINHIFDKEVSEFAFIDLDCDGRQELITIEPFHGDSLNIYAQNSSGWEKVYDEQLFFGHGLSSGMFGDKPVVVVGNRSNHAALEMFFLLDETSWNSIQRICLETGTGTTQTQVYNYKGNSYILSANQRKEEVAIYYLKTSDSV